MERARRDLDKNSFESKNQNFLPFIRNIQYSVELEPVSNRVLLLACLEVWLVPTVAVGRGKRSKFCPTTNRCHSLWDN